MSRYLYEAAFKDVFVSALGGTYGRSIERLFDEPTSDLPVVRVSSLPQEVRTRLTDLRQASASEEDLYEKADEVAEWATTASEAEQTAFAICLQELPPIGACILLSALADAEAKLTSEPLLWAIAGFLDSDDKRLAQATTACLLECGGAFGRALLQDRMKDSVHLPHVRLIQGIMDLLAPK